MKKILLVLAVGIVGVIILIAVVLFAVANGIIGSNIGAIPGVTVITAGDRALAESGDVDAQLELAAIYWHVGDIDLAFYWLNRAAEQGNARAEHDFGVVYRDGMFVEKDYEQAVYWFRKAAEQGH